jgi:hypothetical protein
MNLRFTIRFQQLSTFCQSSPFLFAVLFVGDFKAYPTPHFISPICINALFQLKNFYFYKHMSSPHLTKKNSSISISPFGSYLNLSILPTSLDSSSSLFALCSHILRSLYASCAVNVLEKTGYVPVRCPTFWVWLVGIVIQSIINW